MEFFIMIREYKLEFPLCSYIVDIEILPFIIVYPNVRLQK